MTGFRAALACCSHVRGVAAHLKHDGPWPCLRWAAMPRAQPALLPGVLPGALPGASGSRCGAAQKGAQTGREHEVSAA